MTRLHVVLDTPAPNLANLATVEPGTPDIPFAKSGQLLDATRGAYRRWFGEKYDMGALEAVLATAAAERLGGDPCWLLVVSGSGAAKTETIMPLEGSGALVVSTITGEAALLSGTSEKDRAPDATGGLLRKIGETGVLVVKDVTTIISMSRDSRAEVLAALREIYDGRWNREVGTEGGRTLSWHGKIVVIGAVTTAWDSAHSVIASMGDRFVLVRINSTQNRREAGLQALKNVSYEPAMRIELAECVKALMASVVRGTPVTLADEEMIALLDLADIVTLTRTAVEYDQQGNVISAHAPEMPTRFAKQLAQIVRGGIALGMTRGAALTLAVRCAGDSLPPLRLAVLRDLASNSPSPVSDIVKRLQMPRKTIDRTLQALHLLGVLTAAEEKWGQSTRAVYAVSDGIDSEALARLARNGDTPPPENGKTPERLARNGEGGPRAEAPDTKLARNGDTPVHPDQMTVPGTPPAEAPPAAPRATGPRKKPTPDPKPKRRCQATGCRKNIPGTARSDAQYCSPACRFRQADKRKRAAKKTTPKETP
ncbi:hypothetical protein AB0M95_02000 [Sphaerisporangium sp. NPDC051017]|uniref:hypothetical protein n=1 Tax=Sphaerisporangium sp. NPDC051017 TaxID=3154636 RepID=UPI00341CDC82